MSEDASISYNSIRTEYLTAEELLKRYGNSVKTYSSQWNLLQKSRFIESLLLGIPTTPFYADDNYNASKIIKGKDKIKALSDFFDGNMSLQSLYFKGNLYEGKDIDTLSPLSYRKLTSFKFQLCTINQGVDNVARYGIYTLLQNRMTADTISRCRSVIFTNYHLVKDFAQDCIATYHFKSQQSTIERLVCNVLSEILIVKTPHIADDNTNCHIDLFTATLLDNAQFDILFAQEASRLQRIKDQGMSFDLTLQQQTLYFVIQSLLEGSRFPNNITRYQEEFSFALKQVGKNRVNLTTDIQEIRILAQEITTIITNRTPC